MNDKSSLVFELYDPSKQRKAAPRNNRALQEGKKKEDGETITIFACKMCRLHHKKCSGERPCERCQQKNYLCENLVKLNPNKKTIKESPPPMTVEKTISERMFDYLTTEFDKKMDSTESVIVYQQVLTETTVHQKTSLRYILN